MLQLDPLLAQLVGSRFNIVRGATRVSIPGIRNLQLAHSATAETTAGNLGFGQSADIAQAANAAVGESLERDAARKRPSFVRIQKSSYLKMQQQFPVLPLADMWRYSEEQTADVNFLGRNLGPQDEVEWIEGEICDLESREEIFYPLSLITLNQEWAAPFAVATSSGFALASRLESAIERALCEIIERDGFLSSWWKRESPASYDFSDLKEAGIESEWLQQLKQRIRILDFTDNWGVPCFAALIFGITERNEPALMIGAGCHRSPRIALDRAATEILRAFALTLKFKKTFQAPPPPYDISIQDFSDNLNLYGVPDHLQQIDFLLKGPKPGATALKKRLEQPPTPSVITAVNQRGGRVLSFDMTTIDLKMAGLNLARVIVPEAIPLNVSHQLRPWGCLKLRSYTSRQLNSFPHPFT